MKDALKQIRHTLGFSQQEFADKLSIEVRKLRSYEYETKNYPNEFLRALVNNLNVNLNWLIACKGDMFLKNTNNNVNNVKEPIYLTEKEIVKLKKLLKD